MSRSRIESIELVLSMAQTAEDEAARVLGQHHAKLMQEERQLLDLQSYTAQYMQDQTALYMQDQVTSHQEIYAHALINYSSFIAHLNNACREQIIKLEALRQAREKVDIDWQKKHQKRQAIEEMITRLVKETNQQLERQLQKELDELVVQQAQRQQLTS